MRIDANGLAEDGQAAGSIAASWEACASRLAAHFFALQNRLDVHGRYKPEWMRKPDPKTGKVGPSYTAHVVLTFARLVLHFIGRSRGDVVGLHVSSPAETCKWIVVDIDAHSVGDDPQTNWKMAHSAYLAAKALGFDVMLLDSNGKGGFHIWVVFAGPEAMADAWRLGKWLVRGYADFGLTKAPETFPKSPRLTGKRIGNWVRLPGLHHTRDHWTRAWDGERWLEGTPAIEAILAVAGKGVDLRKAIPAGFEPEGRVVIAGRSNIAMGLTPVPSERRIAMAREALGHLDDGFRDDYDAWVRVGMALRQLGEPGLELWHEWSAPSDKYRPDVLVEKWAGFESDDGAPAGVQLTLGSLFHWAKEAGWPGPSGAKTGRGARGTFDTPVLPLAPSKEADR